MVSITFLVSVIIVACHVVLGGSTYAETDFDQLVHYVRTKHTQVGATDASSWASFQSNGRTLHSPVYVGGQDGMMEADKIDALPGQPAGVNFNQYSGYVTVDPTNGRALFYYFVESPDDSSTKPLVLWLNGGPGCSSLGGGAMMELGPFKVNSDGKTLRANDYAWNKEANILFLESPAGVGFSYSNTTTDYDLSGDKRTAEDSYTFLVNWLERFPQYKTRDFFITGESYAGHYIPQLAQTILGYNKVTNQTVINLRGIAIGNGWIDDETNMKGMFEFFWTHALTSDEIHDGITQYCNFSSEVNTTEACDEAVGQLWADFRGIDIYNIYAPLCTDSSSPRPDLELDPCSSKYIGAYLNLPEVQKSLHANVTGLPYPWVRCSRIHGMWTDRQTTLLPTIQELMASDLRVWIYSGDIDGIVPVTATRYAINKLNTSVQTPWYPWYTQEEVGGYVVEYQQLTFVTVRGSGHFVPSYQPARALTMFSSFLQGKLPPRN